MNAKIFTYLYGGIAVLHIFSRLMPGDWGWLHYLTKPLIMISLGAYVVSHEKTNWSRGVWILLLAIVFSLGGDILLMLPGDYFVFGLASFLLAHVFYIFLFLTPKANGQTSLLKQKVWLLIPFIVFAGMLMWILTPNLGKMLIPVWVYSLIIMCMAITGLNRYGKVSEKSFQYVLWGAILFVISDSFIAINKFAFDIPYVDFWVMSTYISAQYLIVMGILEEFKLKKQKMVDIITESYSY